MISPQTDTQDSKSRKTKREMCYKKQNEKGQRELKGEDNKLPCMDFVKSSV